MAQINYRHLRYFQEVAQVGHLTRAAERLNLSQSALSTQIRQLEARLGHDLFERTGRSLVLTEAGKIALDHADRIFATGDELIATLGRTGTVDAPLRVGAISTLSRNFQLQFLGPVLHASATPLILRSGSEAVLIDALCDLDLDLVLTTEPPRRDAGPDMTAHRIAEQPVGVFGTPARLAHDTLAELLSREPVILPTESSIRTGFESLVARLGVTPRIAAEVDDMAMVRLLVREDTGLAIVPRVVVADEVASGRLAEAPFDLQIAETFYAVTARRSFPHPVVAELLQQDGAWRPWQDSNLQPVP